jgi:transcriptional regulator with XRE-family HTH domain
LKERIEQILAEYQLTPSRFADDIGIQRSGMSHILSGRNKPSLELIQKVLQRFPEINSDWLVQGIGPMKKEFLDPNQISLFDLDEVKVAEKPAAVKMNASKEAAGHLDPLPVSAPESIAPVAIREPLPPPVSYSSEKQPPAVPQPPTEVREREAYYEPRSYALPPEPVKNGKKIERIVIFYTDKTFSEYRQE